MIFLSYNPRNHSWRFCYQFFAFFCLYLFLVWMVSRRRAGYFPIKHTPLTRTTRTFGHDNISPCHRPDRLVFLYAHYFDTVKRTILLFSIVCTNGCAAINVHATQYLVVRNTFESIDFYTIVLARNTRWYL